MAVARRPARVARARGARGRRVGDAAPARAVRRRSRRAAIACTSRPRAGTSTTPSTASPTRRSRCSRRSPTPATCASRVDAMFRGEHVNVTEDRPVLHVALRMPRGDVARRRRRRRRRRGARGARPDGRVRGAGARRARGRGHTGRPDPHRREHRHRRQRPRPRDGVRRAARVQRCRALECRFVSNVDGADLASNLRGPRSRRDAVRRLVEDVHDARDAHERALGRGSGCVDALGADARREALRRGVDQRRRGRRVRHRHRQHVRVLGLGRRPLLDVVGDRAVADGRDRSRALRASCSPAPTRWTSTSAPRRWTENVPGARWGC